MKKKIVVFMIIVISLIIFISPKYIDILTNRRKNEDFLIMTLYTNSVNALGFIEKSDNEIIFSSKILDNLNEIDETMKFATIFLLNNLYTDVFNEFKKEYLDFNNNYFVTIKKDENGYDESIYIISILENLKNEFESAYNSEEKMNLDDIFSKTQKILIHK